MMPLSRYLTRLIWLCLLPLMLLSCWMAFDLAARQQADHNHNAQLIAQSMANATDQRLLARMQAMQMLAASPLAKDPARRAEFYLEAQGFVEIYDAHVILAETDGVQQMLFNTRMPYGSKLPGLPKPNGRSAVVEALASGKPSVGDVITGPVAKESIVTMAVPIANTGHVLLTTVATSIFQKRMDKISLPSGWSLRLLDSTGASIAKIGANNFDPAADIDSSGRWTYRSELVPWSVVLEVPRTIHRAPLVTTAALLLLGVLVATLLGILGGGIAGRRVGQAVAELTEEGAAHVAPSRFTEIEEARRSLLETARLRVALAEKTAASEAKSAFLSTMSHELRTPLNAILGFAQVLQLDPRSSLSGKQQDAVGHILKAGEHLLLLVNEVLDLSRIEDGHLSLSQQSLALDRLFSDCQTLIENQAAKRRIAVDFSGAGDLTVIADPDRLRQVLLNLLSNAVKYGHEDGRVSVSSAVLDDGRVRIAVRDNGPGIPPELQTELFKPFSRLGRESGPIEGAGIGLLISQRLIEAMNGRIGFESVAGQGSTFWVDVPAAVS